jgi:hypothetical protein
MSSRNPRNEESSLIMLIRSNQLPSIDSFHSMFPFKTSSFFCPSLHPSIVHSASPPSLSICSLFSFTRFSSFCFHLLVQIISLPSCSFSIPSRPFFSYYQISSLRVSAFAVASFRFFLPSFTFLAFLISYFFFHPRSKFFPLFLSNPLFSFTSFYSPLVLSFVKIPSDFRSL